MRKVVIAGAGIAGLSAGIYALQSGFEVLILEQHEIPGGNCTGWKRKGYYFEGGLHWLTGSDEKQPLNKLWQEVGALDKNTPIHCRDPFISYDYKGGEVRLYRDLDKLAAHLCSVSPEDTSEISRLCKDVRAFSAMSMPVSDIPGLKVKNKQSSPYSLVSLPKMIPAFLRLSSLNRQSIGEYVKRFRHPAIRMLLSHIAGEEYPVTALVFTLACLASGDGGYVEGGSLKMANDMAERFKKLGGVIQFGVKVDRILTEAGKAVGLTAGDMKVDADAVIIASDTRSAVDLLFDAPIQEPWADEMRKNTIPVTCTFLSMGVEADLSYLPDALIYDIDKPIAFGNSEIRSLSMNNYAAYKGYAPGGCTSITMILEGNYDYWKAARSEGIYKQKKQELAEQVIQRLEEKLPGVKEKIAVWDVATPLTYERYCGTWRGSWMTMTQPGQKLVSYPCKPTSIDRLYFAGHRLMPPGGLPTALITGRQAVQYLCRDTGTMFQGSMD